VTTFVCAVDGALVGESRRGLVHVEALPGGTPEHDIEAISLDAWNALLDKSSNLKRAAEEMLAHHETLHPACEWADRLDVALHDR
jgi:hypothetical protein